MENKAGGEDTEHDGDATSPSREQHGAVESRHRCDSEEYAPLDEDIPNGAIWDIDTDTK